MKPRLPAQEKTAKHDERERSFTTAVEHDFRNVGKVEELFRKTAQRGGGWIIGDLEKVGVPSVVVNHVCEIQQKRAERHGGVNESSPKLT